MTNAEPQSIGQTETQLILRRTPRQSQGFIEPLLEVGDAIPLHMVLIPQGTFIMGSPENELEREDREGPQHEVSVPAFFMGRYPITQAQWRAVVLLPEVNRRLELEPSQFKGENHPIEQISWHSAVEFCDRLAQHTQRPYRLPSEAEWEYACRAGTQSPFYFGGSITSELVNYDANYTYAEGLKGKYPAQTTAVDHYGIANAFGVSDMHGNVWEWCADHWHETYNGAPTDGSVWETTGDSTMRMLRGGSWYNAPSYFRSAKRLKMVPEYRYQDIGFRVACSAPRPLQ